MTWLSFCFLPGLFGGWYDACCGSGVTVGKVQVFDFSLPFMKTVPISLWVLQTDSDFDPTDITGKKIGGWFQLSK